MPGVRPFADLSRAVLGEALTPGQVFAVLGLEDLGLHSQRSAGTTSELRVGSVGYERYKDNADFARRLSEAGVERLVDVRELPISRRRGYAKTALSEAMAAAGIEYVHVRALGNPKPFRDMYKAGRAEEGRAHYERFLREERADALHGLVELLQEKKMTALMCVEHDPATCHRSVITDALRGDNRLDIEIVHIE